MLDVTESETKGVNGKATAQERRAESVKRRGLKYVCSYRDRHGKMRHYFRRRGQPRLPIRAEPGTEEFLAIWTRYMEGDYSHLPVRRVAQLQRGRDYTFIYVIQSEGGPCKVGISVTPRSRVAQMQTGHPWKLKICQLFRVKINEAYAVERQAHAAMKRKALLGEWFDVTVTEAVDALLSIPARTSLTVTRLTPDEFREVCRPL